MNLGINLKNWRYDMFNSKKIAKLEERIAELEDKTKFRWGAEVAYNYYIGRYNASQYIGVNKVLEKIVDHLGIEFEKTNAKEAEIVIKKKVKKKQNKP